MFVLVENNNSYKESIKDCKKYNLIPVTVFNLIIKDKNTTKDNLEKIRQLKSKIQPKYSAVKISIKHFDNTTQGTVNFLKNEFDLVIGYGGLNKTNRFFVEDTQIDFLLDPQNSWSKSKIDFIHHFNSGMNQVLCKAARDNNIGLMISLNFTQSKKYNIAKELGRINQNLIFARKYKISSNINFIIQNPNHIKSKEELIGIMSLFDLSSQQKKKSFEIIEKKINENRFKKSEKYITEGIELL